MKSFLMPRTNRDAAACPSFRVEFRSQHQIDIMAGSLKGLRAQWSRSKSSLRLGEVVLQEWATGDPRQEAAGNAGFLGLTAEPTRQGLTVSPVIRCLSVSVKAQGKAAAETVLDLSLEVQGGREWMKEE